MHIIREDDVALVYEPNHLKRLFPYLDVDCVFDVGANRGQYASMLREDVEYRGRIVSFEPNPRCAEELRRLSRHDPLWHVEERALSRSGGYARLNVTVDDQLSSLATPTNAELTLFEHDSQVVRTLQVPASTLEEAYRDVRDRYEIRRPFLKLDTQGLDVEIVRSGSPIISRFVGLQSELSFVRLYDSTPDYQEALDEYSRRGFVLSALVPNNRGHFPRLIESDCIMIRSDLVGVDVFR